MKHIIVACESTVEECIASKLRQCNQYKVTNSFCAREIAHYLRMGTTMIEYFTETSDYSTN